MNKTKKITIGCLSSILIFLILAYVGAWMIAPGSYPRAERYKYIISEDSLISIINQIKVENPNLELPSLIKLPNGQTTELNGGRRNSKDYWYTIYFYYSDKNQILHTWTRPIDNNSTTFAFTAINNGLTLGNWKTVNENFWWWKNKPEIAEFETRILKLIDEKTDTRIK